jgi:beta-lactamase regulating signal transducer with metallopeptidase domain
LEDCLLACALFFLVTHLRCRKVYKTALPVDNEFMRQWLSEHPTKRRVQIRQSDKIATPLTYGVFRPVILLPKTTDWTDETRLRYILTHEFTHIRRFDTLTKLALAAAVCVHWFNPLVWVMYILANRDNELSCDETVSGHSGKHKICLCPDS